MLCETFPEKKYGNAADIWSFGITLIEMADERPPYSEMNPAKVVFKVCRSYFEFGTVIEVIAICVRLWFKISSMNFFSF